MDIFLNSYFMRLNESGLRYAVMRNYEGMPDCKSGNDIDIMVSPKDMRAHYEILNNVARKENWEIIQLIRRPYIWVVKLVCLTRDENGDLPVLHFDLFPGGSWYGFEFMKYQPALEKRLPHGDFPIYKLSAFDEIFHTIVHHTLYSGRVVKKKYLIQLSNILKQNERSMLGELTILFGAENAKTLIKKVLSDSRVNPAFQKKLRVSLALHCLRTAPFSSVRRWIFSIISEFKQILSPPGIIVSVRGDEQNVQDNLLEIKPWLEKINRLNHVFPNSNLREIELPSFPFSRDQISKYYDVSGDGFIIETKSISNIVHLMEKAKRRGYIILVNSNAITDVKLKPDAKINLTEVSVDEVSQEDIRYRLMKSISRCSAEKFQERG